jgi:hypothetical protein
MAQLVRQFRGADGRNFFMLAIETTNRALWYDREEPDNQRL